MALNTRARQPHWAAMPSPQGAPCAARRAVPACRLLGGLALLVLCAAPAALAQQTTATTPVTLTPVRKGAPAPPSTPAPQEGPAATLKPVIKGSKPAPTPVPVAEKPAAKPALQSDAIGDSDAAAAALPRSPKAAEPARERPARRRSESATATAAAKASKAAKATPAAEEQLEALLAAGGTEEHRAKLRQFVIEHRETPLAARALLGIADLSLKMNDRMEARLAFDSVRRLKQATPAQISSAEAGLAQLDATEGQPVAAVAAAPAASAAPAPTAPAAPPAAGPDPQVLAQQREQATAMVSSTIEQAYQKTVADPAAADEAWKQADALLTEPPGPLDGNTATRLQARLLLGQGLSAELARRDGDARRHYQRLVELQPASREAELARARLGDLDATQAP